MEAQDRAGTGPNVVSLDAAVVDAQLREALAARAERLGLDPSSITTPAPGAVNARGTDGTLLRLDHRIYRANDLGR